MKNHNSLFMPVLKNQELFNLGYHFFFKILLAMCALTMNITTVESSNSNHEAHTPNPVSPVSAVAPVTADLVKNDLADDVTAVGAPETKKSPATSFVLSSPCDAVASDKDEQIKKLMEEVAQLRKMNDKLLSSISESTDRDSKPKSMEQCIVNGFKTMFSTATIEASSKKQGKDYVVVRYMFQFKNGKLNEYLFSGKGEKNKDHPQYDSLTEKEKEIINFYLRHKKAPGAKLEFYRREGYEYGTMDFTAALESDSKDDARKLIDGDTGSMIRAVYAMFSACCRRLFDITYVLSKNLKSITMCSAQRITPAVTKTLFFESMHPGFNDLEEEDRMKYTCGKGILYSTMFFMPDGKYLKECINGLFDMLDVLKTLMAMDC